jgi:hypothetical protein
VSLSAASSSSSFLYPKVVLELLANRYISSFDLDKSRPANVNGFFRGCPLFWTQHVQQTHVRVGFSDYKLLIHAATDNFFFIFLIFYIPFLFLFLYHKNTKILTSSAVTRNRKEMIFHKRTFANDNLVLLRDGKNFMKMKISTDRCPGSSARMDKNHANIANSIASAPHLPARARSVYLRDAASIRDPLIRTDRPVWTGSGQLDDGWMTDNCLFPANYDRAVIIGVSARDIGLDVRDERYRYARQRKQCRPGEGWPDNKRAGETAAT